MVGHSDPEQSVHHLPERLGETRWDCWRTSCTVDTSTLPAARQVQRPIRQISRLLLESGISSFDSLASYHNPRVSSLKSQVSSLKSRAHRSHCSIHCITATVSNLL